MLEEIGQPFEVARLDLGMGAHKSADYLRIHPLGKVPALEDHGQTVFESLAICLYLADRFPDVGLAPQPSDPSRGPYYQWMVYSVATLEPAVFKVASTRNDEAKHKEAVAKLAPLIEVLERALDARPFLLGSNFSAADLMCSSIVGWALDMGVVNTDSAVASWIRQARERPAYARMLAQS